MDMNEHKPDENRVPAKDDRNTSGGASLDRNHIRNRNRRRPHYGQKKPAEGAVQIPATAGAEDAPPQFAHPGPASRPYRPRKDRGDRNAQSKNSVGADVPPQGDMQGSAPGNAQGGKKSAYNRQRPHRDNNKPAQNKSEVIQAKLEQEAKSKPEQDKNQSPRRDGARPAPATGRPRVNRESRKPTDLPRMDNLLIEDIPAETYDSHATSDTDPAEIERILSRDPFARDECNIPDEIPEGKTVIVGVRFRTGGKTYFFDPAGHNCRAGQYAIVETARGVEFGEICLSNRPVDESLVVPPLRPVLRIATEEDIEQNARNREREEEAFRVGIEKIAAHKLDMKLVAVQYTFDNSKLLFYFTSAGRVDFRDLVKDLASVFHIRIELRQIGIRDEARMLGGLGACGRALCCASFLSDFGQVSMKMAKEQGLSLNSNKISGVCGRLMCCLRYEHETYAEELRRTPTAGSFVMTPDGPGVVTEVMPLTGEVKVALHDGENNVPKKYHRSEVNTQPSGHRAGRARDDAPTSEAPVDIPAEEVSEPDTDA